MFKWLKDFFLVKQTFTSVVGDLVGAGAIIVSAPGVADSISATNKPWVILGAAVLAYLGGTISGRTTGR